MRRIQLDEDIKSLSEFRANATKFIRKVHETKRPLVLTQKGKSSAVLLDVGEYEALLDKLELLQDIALAEKQVLDGKGYAHKTAQQKVMEKIKG